MDNQRSQKPQRGPSPGKRLVITPYFRHPKTGKIIRPRNGKVFVFEVDDNQMGLGI